MFVKSCSSLAWLSVFHIHYFGPFCGCNPILSETSSCVKPPINQTIYLEWYKSFHIRACIWICWWVYQSIQSQRSPVTNIKQGLCNAQYTTCHRVSNKSKIQIELLPLVRGSRYRARCFFHGWFVNLRQSTFPEQVCLNVVHFWLQQIGGDNAQGKVIPQVSFIWELVCGWCPRTAE